jgi:hypothetical protein
MPAIMYDCLVHGGLLLQKKYSFIRFLTNIFIQTNF